MSTRYTISVHTEAETVVGHNVHTNEFGRYGVVKVGATDIYIDDRNVARAIAAAATEVAEHLAVTE